jgi:hypothetical protein
MASATLDFAEWLEQADIPAQRLTPQVQALLHAVFRFRQQQGSDYFSTRLLCHFLLHCNSGLKVAQVARLLGLSRPTASRHQGLSSKQAIQQAHHRLNGRPYGKLLPRFAGPIAQFLLSQPHASRADLLDFIDATFAVRVSRIALYKFLKKFGLDHLGGPNPPPPGRAPEHSPAACLPQTTAAPAPLPEPCSATPASAEPPGPPQPAPPAEAELSPQILLAGPSLLPAGPPAPPFCWAGPSTPAPSC